MNTIKSLVKLQFKMYKNDNFSKKKVVSFIFTFCFVCFALTLVSYGITNIFSMVSSKDTLIHFLSLTLFIIQITLLLFSLTNQLKSMFLLKDKLLLARLPALKWQIYIAKTIWCLLKTYILNIIISLPFLISYGLNFGVSTNFYVLSIVAVLFLPLIPYSIASLISVPTMILQNALKNRGVLKLIFSIILTIVVFYLYSKLVFTIADFIFLENTSSGNILVDIAKIFNSNFFPSKWLADFLLQSSNILGNILFFGLSILLTVISITFAAVLYKYIFIQAIVQKTVAKTIKTKNKIRSPFLAYFVTEFKDLFRSSTYSYTYFGMAVSMPIMVWLCNDFIVNFAIERVGENIVFGTTLLIVLIFISIITSPSASFLSKEGDCFWNLKTNPNGIKIPLFAKSSVSLLSSFISLTLTSIVILICGFLDVGKTFILLGISVLFMVAITCSGLIINLNKPNLFKNNKENNSNTISLMILSFVLSLAIGVLAIILSFTISLKVSIITCSTIVGVYSLLSIVILLLAYPKLYAKMEV